jgi:hypothetical protein
MAARGQPVLCFLPCVRGEAPVTAGPGDGMATAARPTSGRSRPPGGKSLIIKSKMNPNYLKEHRSEGYERKTLAPVDIL